MNLINWNRSFIELEREIDPKIEQPAVYIRKKVEIEKPIRQAAIWMTALGVYTGYMNGARLGNQRLTPGYTDYHYRLQFQKYDVTELLNQGTNIISAIVGDGWYRGCIDIGSIRNAYGTKTKFFAILQLIYEDGSCEEIVTDESWKVTSDGALRENNLKTIERYDAMMELENWMKPEYDDSGWNDGISSQYHGQLILQEGEQILCHEHFTPTVLHTPDGNTVLDMGQNFAGHVKFKIAGKSGIMVSLTMGECLDEHGNFTMKNLVAEGAGGISGAVGQRLEYILKDGEQTFEPLFLICGFRYVLLGNWPEEVKAENFEGIAVYSQIPFVGNFSCSNELVNKLVENVRWSQKSNFVDIPGDCPTRERSGWTADMSVFSKTACYISNPRKFLKKWMNDYMLEQSEDGNLPYVIPCAGKPPARRGCMGWSTAIANISEVLYQFYGEKEDLELVYDCVKRFVSFNESRAKKRNKFLFYKHGKHRKYIIETGFHYGEWLEPGHPMYQDFFKAMLCPDTEFTTAWFYTLVTQTAHMAEVLGKEDEKKTYLELAENIKKAYYKEFLKNGRVKSKRQCRYVRPLAHGLIEGELAKQAAADLNEKCIANDYRIGTGFHTTCKVLDVLSDYGYSDTAYGLLENVKQPGWLYAVTKGATTTWESWDGLTEEGKPVDSHNHFAPGAVVSWLFEYCAGIRPLEPGFGKIKIQPVPGGSFTYVNCNYNSIKGEIISNWKIYDNKFHLHVVVPEGVTAEIIMPGQTKYCVKGGNHTYEEYLSI